ncbi:MAG: MarR family transcriptional regulator [Salinivirgaceae bacterium]|nr:MarR family transcriptional regulator [Salinivirgaceae bacterium]
MSENRSIWVKLDNQLCFPFYALSRLITREYQPDLDSLGITYPQYLVLMVFWERDGLTVNEISKKLILNSNTLTPLLKRMEKQDLISRKRSIEDERKVNIHLSDKGNKLKDEAVCIPQNLLSKLESNDDNLNIEKLIMLRENLKDLIHLLT